MMDKEHYHSEAYFNAMVRKILESGPPLMPGFGRVDDDYCVIILRGQRFVLDEMEVAMLADQIQRSRKPTKGAAIAEALEILGMDT